MFPSDPPGTWIFSVVLFVLAAGGTYVVFAMCLEGASHTASESAFTWTAAAITALLWLANHQWWFGRDLTLMKEFLLAAVTLLWVIFTLVVAMSDYGGFYTFVITVVFAGTTVAFAAANWCLWQGHSGVAWNLCYAGTATAAVVCIPRVFGEEIRRLPGFFRSIRLRRNRRRVMP